MGTVSYLRLANCRDEVHVAFITGKAKVASLKQTTIPRLELAAAVLAVHMDRMLKTELQIQLDESVYWTDSQSVLKYIASTTARFKTFVANRVSMIWTLSEVAQWNYISSKLNPADIASHGLQTDAFLQSKTWIHGPEFLRKPQSKRPGHDQESDMISLDDPEVRNVVSVAKHLQQFKTSLTIQRLNGSGWCLESRWEAEPSGSSRGSKAPCNIAQSQPYLTAYSLPRKDWPQRAKSHAFHSSS